MKNEALVLRIKAGDTWQLNTLIERNRGILYRVARRYLPLAERNGAADLDDLCQCAAMGLLEAVAKWQPERGAFLTLAEFHMRRSIRECLGLRGSRQRIENLPRASLDAPLDVDPDLCLADCIADESAVDPLEEAVQADMQRLVREAVRDLPREQREAVEAVHFAAAPCKDYPAVRKGRKTLERDVRLIRLWREYAAAPDRHMGYVRWKHTNTSSTEWAVLQRERLEGLMQKHLREKSVCATV